MCSAYSSIFIVCLAAWKSKDLFQTGPDMCAGMNKCANTWKEGWGKLVIRYFSTREAGLSFCSLFFTYSVELISKVLVTGFKAGAF